MKKTVKITLLGTLAAGTAVGATLPAISCSSSNTQRDVIIKTPRDSGEKLDAGRKLIEDKFINKGNIYDQRREYEKFDNYQILPNTPIYNAFVGIRTFYEKDKEIEWNKVVDSMTSYNESSFPSTGNQLIPPIIVEINLKDGVKTKDESQLKFVVSSKEWKSSKFISVSDKNQPKIESGSKNLRDLLLNKSYGEQKSIYDDWIENGISGEVANYFKDFVTFDGYDKYKWDTVVEGFSVMGSNFPTSGGVNIPSIELTIKFKVGYGINESDKDKISFSIGSMGTTAINDTVKVEVNIANFSLFKISFRQLFEDKDLATQREIYNKLINNNVFPSEDLLIKFKSSINISQNISYDSLVESIKITNLPWENETNKKINDFNIQIIIRSGFKLVESSQFNFIVDNMPNTASKLDITISENRLNLDNFRTQVKEMFHGKSLSDQKEAYNSLVGKTFLPDSLKESFKKIFIIQDPSSINLEYDTIVNSLTIDGTIEWEDGKLNRDIGDINIKLNLNIGYETTSPLDILISDLGKTASIINVEIVENENKKDEFIENIKNIFAPGGLPKTLSQQREVYEKLVNDNVLPKELQESFESIFIINSNDVEGLKYTNVIQDLTITGNWINETNVDINDITIQLNLKSEYVGDVKNIVITGLGKTIGWINYILVEDPTKRNEFIEQIRDMFKDKTLKDQRDAFNSLIGETSLPTEGLQKLFESIFTIESSDSITPLTFNDIVERLEIRTTKTDPSDSSVPEPIEWEWTDSFGRDFPNIEIKLITRKEEYKSLSKDFIEITELGTTAIRTEVTFNRDHDKLKEFKDAIIAMFQDNKTLEEQKNAYNSLVGEDALPTEGLQILFESIFTYVNTDIDNINYQTIIEKLNITGAKWDNRPDTPIGDITIKLVVRSFVDTTSDLDIVISELGNTAKQANVTITSDSTKEALFIGSFKEIFTGNKSLSQQRISYNKLITENVLPTEELQTLFEDIFNISSTDMDNLTYSNIVSGLTISGPEWNNALNTPIGDITIELNIHHEYNVEVGNIKNIVISELGNTAKQAIVRITTNSTNEDLFIEKVKNMFITDLSLSDQRTLYDSLVGKTSLPEHLKNSFENIFDIASTDIEGLTYSDIVSSLTIDGEWNNTINTKIEDITIKVNVDSKYEAVFKDIVISGLGNTAAVYSVKIESNEEKEKAFIDKVKEMFKSSNLKEQEILYTRLVKQTELTGELKTLFEEIFTFKNIDLDTDINYGDIVKNLKIVGSNEDSIEWKEGSDIGDINIELNLKDIYVDSESKNVNIEISDLGIVNPAPKTKLKIDTTKEIAFKTEFKKIFIKTTLEQQRNTFNNLTNNNILPSEELKTLFAKMFIIDNSFSKTVFNYDDIIKKLNIDGLKVWEDTLTTNIGDININIELKDGYEIINRDLLIKDVGNRVSTFRVKTSLKFDNELKIFENKVRAKFQSKTAAEQREMHSNWIKSGTIPTLLDPEFKKLINEFLNIDIADNPIIGYEKLVLKLEATEIPITSRPSVSKIPGIKIKIIFKSDYVKDGTNINFFEVNLIDLGNYK